MALHTQVSCYETRWVVGILRCVDVVIGRFQGNASFKEAPPQPAKLCEDKLTCQR